MSLRIYYHNCDGDMVEVDPHHGRWPRDSLWVKLEDVDTALERAEAKARRKAKAADISDEMLLAAVSSVSSGGGMALGGEWRSATLWDVQEALAQFPEKVVLAKLRSAVKRGLLKGCTCGCRGEFELHSSPSTDEKSGVP